MIPWHNRKSRCQRRLERAERQYAIPPKIYFMGVLDKIKTWCQFAVEDRDADPIAYLDFIIDTIADDIRISAASEAIYCRKNDDPRDWRKVFSQQFIRFYDGREKVELSGKTVISSIYSHEKLYKASTHIKHYGFRINENYFTGVYFPELRLVVITNGQHHSCVAAQNHCIHGECIASVCRLEKLFGIVRTDGEYWYFADQKLKVGDVRFAILFEVAREKARLLSEDSIVQLSDMS